GRDPKFDAAHRALVCLQRNPGLGRFTQSQLHRDHLRGGPFKEPGALAGPLSVLVAHGYLGALTSQGQPGPTTMAYEVNPLWRRLEFHELHEMPAANGELV